MKLQEGSRGNVAVTRMFQRGSVMAGEQCNQHFAHLLHIENSTLTEKSPASRYRRRMNHVANSKRSLGLLAFGVAAAMACCASFSAADAESSPSTHANLQVLPKDTSALAMTKLMQRYAEDLGVSCSHCHVQDTETRRFDYVSDENQNKHVARAMIGMLNDINGKYLAQIGRDRRYAVPITCGSCHQGQSSPPAFESRSP